MELAPTIMQNKEQAMITRQTGTEVADNVYWFAADGVNWYIIASDDELTIVDAGLPAHWELLQEGLETLEYEVTDVKALILTHTDIDHIGFAERLREHGVPIWVHEEEYADALDGGRNMPPRVLLHLWRPSVIRVMLASMRAGAFSVPAITDAQTFEDGQELDVPGTPTVIHVPGHTIGQSAFWFPDRTVLCVGDALFTVDSLTGKECEPAPGRLSEADINQAKQSIQVLAEFEEVTVLPGHGNPWHGHLGNAVATHFENRTDSQS